MEETEEELHKQVWCGNNVMRRALWEQREKAPNSARRSVKLPIRSEGLVCSCQVKKLENCASSRKNNRSELANCDPG